MHAFEIPGLRYSLPAGGAVARHRFVKANADSLATQAVADSVVIGASMNAVVTTNGVAADLQIVEIADGIVIVDAAGAIVAGAEVASDANGKAVTVTTETNVAGVALTDTAGANELVTVKIG